LSKYPFNLPAFANFDSLEFQKNVTFIVGENGSGKSTLLEAIAIAMGFNAEGGTINFNFNTKSTHSDLHKHLIISRGQRKEETGFFLRAESFYNVATEIDKLNEIAGIQPLLDSYGGISLHNQSHGESFFSLMKYRFGKNGLYILDEPEAAISPSRQLGMIALIHDLVKKNCQFIISTHSPILLSYPDAIIYEINDGIFQQVSYENTDIYTTTKHYLHNYSRILKIILSE